MDKKKINTILIANRCEIARRIIRTSRKLGIKTIAVFNDLDKDSLFVREADIKVPLNGVFAKDTYSNIDKIVSIAKEYKVDGIHPGYGFLSENIEFVKRLEEEKIRFIGPSSYSMEAMSDKLKAKLMAEKANVPMVPGCKELITDVKQALVEAKKIGFPVMFKAVAGGGGKGIRIVYKEEDIKEQFETAKYEGKTIYKNDDILLEKFIENPRHIEIQIVADKFGNVVCLGERECSIQRFNQKVIEECPSSFVDENTRQKMYECAVRLVKQCKYYSAGTLEFIMDKNKNFYFLEMNTRLQVEHPVTEYVTGIDLVETMINIEEGKKLPFTQKDIHLRGHALECRICTENPAKGFMPSSGKILHYIEPTLSNNVRVESGIELGDEISPYYDSMVAKLITYGDTRKEAIENMKTSLGEYEIGGLETNINLLESIVRQEDFVKGNISTSFIKQHYPNGFNSLPLTDNTKKAFIATAIALYVKNMQFRFNIHETCHIPRDSNVSKLYVCINNDAYLIDIIEMDDGFLKISYNNEEIQLKFSYQRGNMYFRSSINGIQNFSIRLSEIPNGYIMQCAGTTANIKVYNQSEYELLKYMPEKPCNNKPKFLLSPMTGKITKIKVEENNIVNIGQHLLSIEAMKMDNTILSENKTKIVKIFHNIGDNIKSGEKLIEFDYSGIADDQ